MNKDFIMSYSGGKDSIFALYRMIENGYKPHALFTIMRQNNAGSNCHRLSKDSLLRVSKALGIPIFFLDLQCNIAYDEQIEQFLKQFQSIGINTCVYGDISLIPSRDRSQEVCDKIGMNAIFPLWQMDEEKYVQTFIKSGFKAVIKSVLPSLEDNMLGQSFDFAFLARLKAYDVSICGENGEYHTYVYDGPMFKWPVSYSLGNILTALPYKTIEIL